jgi:hypothetical protein
MNAAPYFLVEQDVADRLTDIRIQPESEFSQNPRERIVIKKCDLDWCIRVTITLVRHDGALIIGVGPHLNQLKPAYSLIREYTFANLRIGCANWIIGGKKVNLAQGGTLIGKKLR